MVLTKQMNGASQQNIFFAEFELDTAHRRLSRSGKPLALYAKTFDLLIFLLEHNGQIVTKDEVLAAVWAGQFVEEANLSVQVSALRKALGEKKDAPRFLVTVPGKGYKFVADIENGNGEIIIEKHKVSRVVVEEEIQAERGKEGKGEREKETVLKRISAFPRFPISLSQIIAVGAVLICLELAVGVYFLKAKKTNPPFERIKLTRLTNNGKTEAAAVSPDGKFIAYVLSEAEGNSLWVRQMSAANDTRIVPPVKAEFWGLTFTPDGTQIYYNLFAADKADNELFRIPTLGGLAQKVPKVIAWAISFAPDGKRFAYIAPDSEAGQNYLIIADADGTNHQIIANKPQPNTYIFDGDYTAWSPDGETIVCLVNYLEAEANFVSIVGVSVKDGTEKLLSLEKWREVQSFEWMKDGSGLLVSGSEKNSSKNQIWFVPQPIGETRPITNDLNNYSWLKMNANGDSFIALQTASVNSLSVGAANGKENTFKEIVSEVGILNPFVWTPDGKIVFRSTADGVANLWMINADGTNHRQVTADAQADERGMCITPDGKFIVFTSWRSGKSNLWRVTADGGNLTQLTNGEADAHPRCPPDGQTVIYQRGIFSQPRLWKVSINGGEPAQLTDFPAKWGAISTDGKQISFFQMSDDKWHIGIIPSEGGAILQRLDVPAALKENEIRWSTDNLSLFFIGAIGNVGNVWTLPLDGGEPKPVTNFKSHYLEDFAWSPNGKQLAVSRSLQLSDVVLIEKAE